MKKVKGLLCIVLVFLMIICTCGCSTENAEKQECDVLEENESEQTLEQDTADESIPSEDTQEENNTSSLVIPRHVILSFLPVSGATIYDLEYDSDGYLCHCYYHQKCDSCGYVDSSARQAGGYVWQSFKCSKCGKNNTIHIEVVDDWIKD